MKNVFFLIFLVCNFCTAIIKAQQVCFLSPFTVTNAEVDSLGNQIHTLDVQVQNTSNFNIEYRIKGVSGQILQSGTSIILPDEVQDNTFDIFQTNTINYGEVFIEIVTAPSGYNNGSCSDIVRFNLPAVPVCLEILSAQEVNCIVDNDGIGIDGDIHVYQMQVLNNDIAPFEFSITASQDLSVEYHPEEFILPGETKTVTYFIRSQSGLPASGEISFLFEGQNYSSGCEAPLLLTFQPCEVSVCLEFGAVDYDGCGSNPDGTVSHTFNANVNNASDTPLQYTIIPLSGGSILGGTSKTIAAHTSELISFDYITNPSNAQFNFYIETETVGVTNGCEEVISLTLPNCGIQSSTGAMSLFAFFDQNNNGEADESEGGLSDIEFRITKMGTGDTKVVTTNVLGQALVFDLEPGLYLINQEINLPWSVTKPVAGAMNNVLVVSGKTTTLDFANYHPNAGIPLIKLHNVEAVCHAQLSTGDQMYKVSGQLSTSFLNESMLQAFDIQGGSISNLAIGMVPPLASYVPFSFNLLSAAVDSAQLEFRLSTSMTQARNIMRLQLQPCCEIGSGLVDTLSTCETVTINYGAYVLPSQNIRLIEVNVTDFQPCTQMICFESNNGNLLANGIYVIDGDTITGGNHSFVIPTGVKKLTFYLDATFGSGQIKITAYGCQDTCVQSFTVGQHFTNQNTVSLSQETPSFSNIYGASFRLNDLGTTLKPKYVCLGIDQNQSNAQVLGVTSANYFYLGGRDGLLPLEKVDHTNTQVRFSIPEFAPYDQKQFNILYTANKKDIALSFAIYADDGTLLGKGNMILDGDKVVSKIDDLSWSEDDILLYPNPATDIVNVSIKTTISPTGMPYKITDILGKTVRQGIFDAEDEKIDVSILSTGPYILETTESNGKSSQIKFLKVK